MNLEHLASEAIEIAVEMLEAEVRRAGVPVDPVALLRAALDVAPTDIERRAFVPDGPAFSGRTRSRTALA